MYFIGKNNVKFLKILLGSVFNYFKVLIFVFILFFLFSPSAQAVNRNYQKIHGQELDIASVEIRQAFYEDYGWDWYDSYYESRKEFLDSWYINLDKNKKLKRREARTARTKVRVANQKRRAIDRARQTKQRNKLTRKRNERKKITTKVRVERNRKKKFERKKKDFGKKLRDLKKKGRRKNR